MTTTATESTIELRRARRDLARGLDQPRVRWLVDYYYTIQDFRIQAQGQVRTREQGADEGTFELGEEIFDRLGGLEKEIVTWLDAWTTADPVSLWAKSICGIGPVLAAGLAAHIDIDKAPTVGHIWRFAGLDPTQTWDKGQKRPWNASLKTLCWKIGDSFVKVSSRESDVYGKVYRERKELELARDAAGMFADQARHSLESRSIKDADLKRTYEAGHLPAGRLDLRARRYAVKLFLAHWHHVAWEIEHGEAPVKPYILTQEGGHAHFIAPPNWPMV